MPGVSSRLPAKGIHGFGKVHFKFKPKPPPKGHKVLGSIIYAVFFTALLLSFGWSRPYLKYNYVLPGLRKLLSYAENLKTRISTVPEVRANSLQLNYITEVHSKTVHGALFDQGYLHATDRLVQMDILRRTALGTLSEYYGNVTVELDKFYRSLNIRDIAQHDLRALDKTGVVNLESYSAGVNMYLSAAAKGSYGGSLPIEYDFQLGLGSYSIEPWEPVHTLAVLRLLAYQWSHGWETQLVEILATKSAHVSASSLWFSRRPSASDSGSSIPTLGGVSIAVSAEKSASKAALLANSFTASATHAGLWYFNALNVPNILRVSGASVPGVPYVFIGRNRNISWGISRAAHSDYEKLFFEHSNGFTSKSGDTDTSTTTIASTSDRGSEGEEGKVTLREEFITVRGQAEPLLHTARDSVHGPLVSDLLTPTLTGSIAQLKLGWTSFALSSPALEQPLSLSFLYKINTASSFEEFASGVEDLTAVALNFVYADSNGNIGSVVSGSKESHVAVNRQYNPASGMIIAADNSAQVSRVCQRLKCATSTATAALPVTSSEDLQALLTDAFSPSSLVLRKIILEVSPSDATDSEMEQKEIRTMQNLVADFDGVYTTAAAAPVLLEAFRVALVQRVLKSLGGASSAAAGSAMCPADRVRGDSLRSEIQWIYDSLLKPDSTCKSTSTSAESTVSSVCAFRAAWWHGRRMRPADLVLDALRDAVEWCKGTFGADSATWTWGQAHIAQYSHPNPKWTPILDEMLSKGPAGMSGALDSIQRADYLSPTGLITTNVLHHAENMAATSLRVVFDMADKRCYRGLIPTTQSQRLSSPLAGGVQQLSRWAHSDAQESYDDICWADVEEGQQNVASNKDEL